MGDYIFWESVQKARLEHFCDWCCNYIEPGMTYSRKVWVPRKGSFHVMCEHVSPRCPPNMGELHMLEIMQKEQATLGVPIAFEMRVKEMLVIERDGRTRVEYESEAVPVIGFATPPPPQDGYDDVEIPF